MDRKQVLIGAAGSGLGAVLAIFGGMTGVARPGAA